MARGTADARRRAAIDAFAPTDEVRTVFGEALGLSTREKAFPGGKVFASSLDASWYMSRFPLPPGTVLYVPAEGKAFVQLDRGAFTRPSAAAARNAGDWYAESFRVARVLADRGPVTGGTSPASRNPASVRPAAQPRDAPARPCGGTRR